MLLLLPGAFGVLWNISTGNESNRECIIAANGVELVLRTVRANLDEGSTMGERFAEDVSKLHGAAVLLLWNISFSPRGRAEIVRCGGSELLERMRPRFEDDNVAQYAEQLLHRLRGGDSDDYSGSDG